MIPKNVRTNFNTLQSAWKDGNIALMEVRDAALNVDRYAVCAMSSDDQGMITPSPFAVMVWDNPFEMFLPPNENGGFHSNDARITYSDQSIHVRADIRGFFPKLRTGVYDVSLGNGTMFTFVLVNEKRLYIGISGAGCYSFAMSHDSNYIAEKLKIMAGDGLNIKDFIADQLEITQPREGHYHSDLYREDK